MLFNSAGFLLFFPIVTLIYFLIPHKYRYVWIFATSYYFYMCWNPVYAFLLLGVTVFTYFCSIFIEKRRETAGKSLLLLAVIFSVALLSIFKYSSFISKTISEALSIVHINLAIPSFSFVIPVGISFYLFQSLGYVIDVYKGKIKAEKNFVLYAAYISFFPQLVAGPIERADKLLPQFYEEHRFDYERVKNNLLLMLYGFFMKIVVADRIAIFVDTVYDNYSTYDGWLLIMATVLFAFQIYCDFAGYSTIAKGAAGVMGFELMDNFNAPYCAMSVKEFWGRWHISLTSWFRDYVYIPLGGNRKGAFRKGLNTLIVFFLSGLWHGPSWSYILWGLLNGFYIVIEGFIKSFLAKVRLIVKLPAAVKRIFGTLITFILVDFSWIFFRAPGLGTAKNILKSMLTFNHFHALRDNTIHFYIMEQHAFFFMLFSIVLLIIVDICHYRGFHYRKFIFERNIFFRWSFYWLFLMSIIIFGVWGPAFDQSAFIYFQF